MENLTVFPKFKPQRLQSPASTLRFLAVRRSVDVFLRQDDRQVHFPNSSFSSAGSINLFYSIFTNVSPFPLSELLETHSRHCRQLHRFSTFLNVVKITPFCCFLTRAFSSPADSMFKGIYNGRQCHAADIPAVLARAWSAGVDRIIVMLLLSFPVFTCVCR